MRCRRRASSTRSRCRSCRTTRPPTGDGIEEDAADAAARRKAEAAARAEAEMRLRSQARSAIRLMSSVLVFIWLSANHVVDASWLGQPAI